MSAVREQTLVRRVAEPFEAVHAPCSGSDRPSRAGPRSGSVRRDGRRGRARTWRARAGGRGGGRGESTRGRTRRSRTGAPSRRLLEQADVRRRGRPARLEVLGARVDADDLGDVLGQCERERSRSATGVERDLRPRERPQQPPHALSARSDARSSWSASRRSTLTSSALRSRARARARAPRRAWRSSRLPAPRR